jgi:2-C-methyl-D-erythritol 4-phosphate cytidylyltransferase
VVLPENHIETWSTLKNHYNFSGNHKTCKGGETRFHSVLNGLKELSDQIELVAVHDGVRPLVSKETIERSFSTASLKGSAIPVLKPVDSIRKVSESHSASVNREEYRIVQTPQCFRKSILMDAYKQNFNTAFTDDASVVEANGNSICLCDGNPENIKITTPSDIIIAEALLKNIKK